MGDSFRIVPTLTENCFRHFVALHFQIRRVLRNIGSLAPQYGHSTPLGQRFAARYCNELSGLSKWTIASANVFGVSMNIVWHKNVGASSKFSPKLAPLAD